MWADDLERINRLLHPELSEQSEDESDENTAAGPSSVADRDGEPDHKQKQKPNPKLAASSPCAAAAAAAAAQSQNGPRRSSQMAQRVE